MGGIDFVDYDGEWYGDDIGDNNDDDDDDMLMIVI